MVNSLEINGLIQKSFKRFQILRPDICISIWKSGYFWVKINLQNVAYEKYKKNLFAILPVANRNV